MRFVNFAMFSALFVGGFAKAHGPSTSPTSGLSAQEYEELVPTPPSPAKYRLSASESTTSLTDQKWGLSRSQLAGICNIRPKGFPIRILVRPSRFQKTSPEEFQRSRDVVVIGGEEHVMKKSTVEDLLRLALPFRNYGFENIGKAKYIKVVRKFDRERQKKEDPAYRPSGTFDVREDEIPGLSGAMNYLIEAQTPSSSQFGKGNSDANRQAFDLEVGGKMNFWQRRQYYQDKKSLRAGLPLRGESFPLDGAVSWDDNVKHQEAVKAQELEQKKRLKQWNALLDTRNKVMSDHIHSAFQSERAPLAPLLTAVGYAHVAGLKFELMTRYGFKEMDEKALSERCQDSDIVEINRRFKASDSEENYRSH